MSDLFPPVCHSSLKFLHLTVHCRPDQAIMAPADGNAYPHFLRRGR